MSATSPVSATRATRRPRCLEDFKPGDRFEHHPGRTLTEADNIWFSLLTMNQHPLHCDAEFARTTEFKRPLIASTLTLAVLVGQSVADISQDAVANLGWKEVRMTAPLFPGDTLYAESEILDVRASQSRPHQGIVTAKTVGRNQHGVVVCEFIRSMLYARRNAAGPGGAAKS